MNLANKLTLSRIIIIPFYILLFLFDFKNHYYYALIIFILASITDFIDGYIARNKNLVTTFGKFADPLADKMLVTASLLCFMSIDRIGVWVLFIVLAREFAVTGLRAAVAAGGVVLAAGIWGKAKTFFQMTGLIYLHLEAAGHFKSNVIGDIFIYIMLLLTVISGVEYFYKNKDSIQVK
jgi:CDP-diacylglycerol--glycerol-3-phosphate 3-phosphatidyltransferase